MSRFEARGIKYSMAYGVDHMPLIGTFVQVWDHSKYDMPDGDNIVLDLHRVNKNVVIHLAWEYNIPLDDAEVSRNLDAVPDDQQMQRRGIFL